MATQNKATRKATRNAQPNARTPKVKATRTRAEALKAYNESTNAQRAADALHMAGRSFRNIARDLGFGPQKYGTSWDARARATVLKDARIQRHIEREFGKATKPRARKATPATPATPQNES